MKMHNGMRPLDIAVLLKIAAKKNYHWYMKDLSEELLISASEISESINRSTIAKLLREDRRSINTDALLEFLEYGIRYVFPQEPGTRVKGLGTAHNAMPLYNKLLGIGQYVWKYSEGNLEGQILKPLHPNIPQACLKDDKFYELVALTDSIRVGTEQEQDSAMNLLKNAI